MLLSLSLVSTVLLSLSVALLRAPRRARVFISERGRGANPRLGRRVSDPSLLVCETPPCPPMLSLSLPSSSTLGHRSSSLVVVVVVVVVVFTVVFTVVA